MAENRDTLVHQRLGLGRINKICADHGLVKGDKEEVHQILTECEVLGNDINARSEVIQKISGRNLRKDQIVKAIMTILEEFAFI